MNPLMGAEGAGGSLLSQLVAGGSGCEARLRLLERRLTGQPGELSNGAGGGSLAAMGAAVAPQNLASGFESVATGLAAAAHAGFGMTSTFHAPGGGTLEPMQPPQHAQHAAAAAGHAAQCQQGGSSEPLQAQHAQHAPLASTSQPSAPAQSKQATGVKKNTRRSDVSGDGQGAGIGGSKRRRVFTVRNPQADNVAEPGPTSAAAAGTAPAPSAVAAAAAAPAPAAALAIQVPAPSGQGQGVAGSEDRALPVPASPATNRTGAPEDVCQTPGSRGPKPSASNAAGAGGAAVGPPPRSPFVGKPAPRSGGGGGGGKTTAAAARGQTKLSTFFPMVDTNSRDSDGSAGGAACSGPLGVASAAERAAAAAAAAINGAPGGLALGQGGVGVSAAGAGAGARQLAAVAESVAAEQAAVLQQRLEAKDREVRELQEQLSRQAQQLQLHMQSAGEVERMRLANDQLRQQWEASARAASDKEEKMRAEIGRALQTGTKVERELQRLKLAMGASRLGGVAVQRAGPMQVQEVWEDGPAHHNLVSKLAALNQQREELEAARKALRKKLAPPGASSTAAGSVGGGSVGGQEYMSGTEFVTMDEIYKLRLAALKREEEAVKAEEERLNGEKLRHVRLLKRIRDEECSRFGNLRVLANRYQLLSLLGKGGFSEVYKAYDLHELKYAACKIHQLNPHWSEPKKQSYVKHAVREYEIHKGLRHPNIVGLLDILEIDSSSFATILDLCEGPDLDTVLREHGMLPEKEARAIIAQVFSALVHLNQPSHRIIHYDLKPANILFDSMGLAKVTDFGLSKVVEEGQTMGMELTSQGAGTYWYLPPECFEMGGHSAPRISNKVDVWSAGVILYQMLFGRRPFGEGMTQEQILRDRVMLNAREVEFPPKPSVSADAKEFIRKCLAYRQEMRWDVLTAALDPYLCLTKQAAAAAAAQQQQQQQQGLGTLAGMSAGVGLGGTSHLGMGGAGYGQLGLPAGVGGLGMATAGAAAGRRGGGGPTGFRGLLSEMGVGS